MNGKPLHFDGSSHPVSTNSSKEPRQPFKLTLEMRKYLSGNPYQIPSSK
ncbi:hypothetical protein [Planococcus lenghuensis]|nr:hypothetical protein [Planococcus lenghuensis]